MRGPSGDLLLAARQRGAREGRTALRQSITRRRAGGEDVDLAVVVDVGERHALKRPARGESGRVRR
jgi:hypothetical protein